MAVLQRHQAQLRPPPDFGLGLIVTAIFGGILLLLLLGASSIPAHGPRGEAQAPQSGTYVDIQAPSAAPSAILPQR
jgi:hypothetical protein